MKYYFDFVKPEYYKSIGEYRTECLESGSKFDGCFNLEDCDDIEKWDLNCKLFENEVTLPPGYSIGFQYVYLKDDEVVGMVNFRPKAMEHIYLKEYGGHIGYSVKPSKRNKGIATRMLKDFLVICKDEYHLDSVLITCTEHNEGSRKVILNNGGVYENKVFYTPENCYLERYWIKL